MAVSSLDKEVATRLFKMLAVNEMAECAIKRDAASYAKLSLLTQQAGLLQHQAKHVVNKAEAAAKDESLQLNCTTLATEYGEGTKRLLMMLDVPETTISTVKKDPMACGKLSLLADQVGLLQQQAKQAVDEAELNRHLSEIMAGTVVKPVTGTIYYHYTQNGKATLSRIAHHEWSNYEEYHGKFLYDYDFTFRRLFDEDEQQPDVGFFGQQQQDLYCKPAPCSIAAAGKACDTRMLLDVKETPATVSLDLTDEHDAEPMSMDADMQTAPDFKPLCAVLSRW